MRPATPRRAFVKSGGSRHFALAALLVGAPQLHNYPRFRCESRERTVLTIEQFARQQRPLARESALCRSSLPAFVSQHAAKNPMHAEANFRVTKAARQICAFPAFRGK
jgi:hypothetical protein